MNVWAKKTVKLAQEGDYLDRLHEIYPVEPKPRTIANVKILEIQEAYKRKDKLTLINRLLDLEKFPYKDSYVAFLRRDRTSIQRNPETVNRIFSVLTSMGLPGIIQGITAPKEANTRRGNSFSRWLRNNFSFMDLGDFKKSRKGVVLLSASEKELMHHCNNELEAGLQKRPDVLAKVDEKYVVGEAKFLSDLGGNQGRGFDDAIKVASNPARKAVKISLLDGIVWVESKCGLFQSIKNSSLNVFSALLLRNFLQSLRKSQ